MSVETFDITDSIRVTDAAAKHFSNQLTRSGSKAVRISLKESGCNGLSYVVEGVDSKAETDLQLDLDNGVSLFIDLEALPAMQGTEIDLSNEGLNGTLKFNNPNIKEECGCGESFTV